MKSFSFNKSAFSKKKTSGWKTPSPLTSLLSATESQYCSPSSGLPLHSNFLRKRNWGPNKGYDLFQKCPNDWRPQQFHRTSVPKSLISFWKSHPKSIILMSVWFSKSRIKKHSKSWTEAYSRPHSKIILSTLWWEEKVLNAFPTKVRVGQ